MNKLLSMLGLARRAGKLVPGFDAVSQALRAHEACGVLLAADVSEKTEKNIRFEAEKVSVPVIRTEESLAEMSRAIGKKAGVIALGDQGFWTAVSKLTKTPERIGD